MSKYRAVVFDLYDTLVTIDPQEYVTVKRTMAETLGVDPEEFLRAWKRYTRQAALGEIHTVEDRLARVTNDFGLQLNQQLLVDLANRERVLQEERVRKLPGCDEVLAWISNKGLKLALGTNTSSVSKTVLGILGIKHWFDVILYSFECNLVKPDLSFYWKISELLGLASRECIFVGDGNDRELDGAKDAGMLAIKVGTSRDAQLSSKQSTRYDLEVDNLADLIPLIIRLNNDVSNN